MSFLKFVITWVSVISFTMHSSAWGSMLNETQKAAYLSEAANSFNKRQDLDKIRAELERLYKTEADREYLNEAIKNTSKSQLFSKPAAAEVKDGILVLNLPNARAVKIEMVSKGVVKINGQEFVIDLSKPLKETHQNLTKLLQSTLFAQNNSLFNLLVPEAQALWPLLAVIAIFFVLPIAAYLATLTQIQSELDAALEACEKRDKNVAFEDSDFYVKLQVLKSHSFYTLEDQRKIRDCATWARTAAQQPKAPSVDTLLSMCLTGEKILKCADKYKSESAELKAKPATTTK